MDEILRQVLGLLAISTIVSVLARRLRLPYTVGLVAMGMALVLGHAVGGLSLTHDFIFDVILPPLLFEAGINIRWRDLRRDALPILFLAIFGTLISAAVVTAGMMALGWPAAPSLLFGVLIAATDPVAVIAMFKDNQVGGRLLLLTESESLFNDGVAAVLFTLALGWAQTGAAPPALVAQTLGLSVGGGILAGFACAGLALAVMGQTADHLVESTVTTITAYGAFLAAEPFGGSGVLATITAGLMVGNFGLLTDPARSRVTSEGRAFALALWEFIAFIANSLVFLLIGIAVARIPFSLLGAASLAVIIALVLLARACAVYPLCLLFARSRRKISWPQQHVLWWGGLRGALALALALSLPETLVFRNEILVATFGVVAFSVLAQGLTMPFLLRYLGFAGEKKAAFFEKSAQKFL